MKKITILLVFIFVTLHLFSQSVYDNYKLKNSTKVPEYQGVDMDFYMKVLEKKKQMLKEEEEARVEKAKSAIKQTKKIYSSIEKFPANISNGWHSVTVTNNEDFCDERKVFVENNKITKYVVENWINREVAFSAPVQNAKGMIKLKTEQGSSEYLDVYFIEYTYSPGQTTTAPLKPGKINFWSSLKRGSEIEIYFEDEYIGKLTQYFADGSPTCGQIGTVTLSYKPGTYNYVAKSERSIWKGTLTISAEECRQIELGK